ncbi:MAG: ATP-binding protein, partial [Candidatus Aenigmatarchaeota archaeon]
MYDKKLVADYVIKKTREIRELKFFEREIKIDFIPNKAVSIIGPRRSGKSFLLKIIGKKLFKNPFYVDLEDIELKKLEAKEFFELIAIYTEVFGEEPDVLLVDEIQNLEDWSSLVRSLIDRNYKVLMSGSSSKLLSKEIATQLRGRTISYVLLPLSFKEFLSFKGFTQKKFLTLEEEAKIKRLMKEYLTEGSYPEVVLAESEERKRRILSDYYTTILYKDFVDRFKLKSLEVAKFIFDFFLQNYSCLFSVNKVANFLTSQGIRFGKTTIYEYIEKLPETLSFFFVENFGKSIYERKSWPKKIYVCDLGLANIVKFSEEFGRRMENCIFLELH